MDYYDNSPPDPFIKSTIVSIYNKNMRAQDGAVPVCVCDLQLGKSDLIAYAIPLDYIIRSADLNEWAIKIGDWFKNYPSTCGIT